MSEIGTPVDRLLVDAAPRSPIEERDLEVVRQLSALDDPWDRTLPVHLTASALIVDPASQRVLLRWHERQQSWIQVGGHADPGETDPVAIAEREACEETGLTDLVQWPASSSPRLVHVVIVPVPSNAREPAHRHADLRFVLATRSLEGIVAETRHAPLRWLTIEEARSLTSEDNVRETLARVGDLFAVNDSLPDEGGDAACWLERVCDRCGALVDDGPHTCRSAVGEEPSTVEER